MVCLSALILLACITNGITNASMCRPGSSFKLDCNTCNCSMSGLEYTCTKDICLPSAYSDNYDMAQTKEGYIILKPKPKTIDQYIFDDHNDFVNNNNRKPRDGPNQFPEADERFDVEDGGYKNYVEDKDDYKETESNNINDIYNEVDETPNKNKHDYEEIERNIFI